MSAGNYPSKSSKVIGVRLLNADHARVEARAAAAETSPSLWARQVILAELDAPRNEEFHRSMDEALSQQAVLAETTLPEAQKALGETVSVTEVYDLKDPACPVVVVPPLEKPWPQRPPDQIITDGKIGTMAEHMSGEAKPASIEEIPRGFHHVNRPRVGLSLDESQNLGEKMDEFHETMVRSWHAEWAKLEAMEPAEAQERMKQLCAGRTLPREFKGWSRAERIAWLEKEWPL